MGLGVAGEFVSHALGSWFSRIIHVIIALIVVVVVVG